MDNWGQEFDVLFFLTHGVYFFWYLTVCVEEDTRRCENKVLWTRPSRDVTASSRSLCRGHWHSSGSYRSRSTLPLPPSTEPLRRARSTGATAAATLTLPPICWSVWWRRWPSKRQCTTACTSAWCGHRGGCISGPSSAVEDQLSTWRCVSRSLRRVGASCHVKVVAARPPHHPVLCLQSATFWWSDLPRNCISIIVALCYEFQTKVRVE